MRTIYVVVVAMVLCGCAGEAMDTWDEDGGDTETETESDAGADAAADVEVPDPDETFCALESGWYKRCEGDIVLHNRDDLIAWEDQVCTHVTGSIRVQNFDVSETNGAGLSHVVCVDGTGGIEATNNMQMQVLMFPNLKRASRVMVSGNGVLSDLRLGLWPMPQEQDRWFQAMENAEDNASFIITSNDHLSGCFVVGLYKALADVIGYDTLQVVGLQGNLDDGCAAEAEALSYSKW